MLATPVPDIQRATFSSPTIELMRPRQDGREVKLSSTSGVS